MFPLTTRSPECSCALLHVVTATRPSAIAPPRSPIRSLPTCLPSSPTCPPPPPSLSPPVYPFISEFFLYACIFRLSWTPTLPSTTFETRTFSYCNGSMLLFVLKLGMPHDFAQLDHRLSHYVLLLNRYVFCTSALLGTHRFFPPASSFIPPC